MKSLHAIVYREEVSRQWRWRLKAGNGRIVADCGEGYHNRKECLAGLRLATSVRAFVAARVCR